jgi:hypothetical protein
VGSAFRLISANPSHSRMQTAPTLEHRFNDDLLISDVDQTFAKEHYTTIYHILDHPELREEFLRYDALAIRSRRWVHCVGMAAVVLCASALLGSAATPLLRQFPTVPKELLSGLLWLEIGGILGVVIAAGGLWISGARKKWLEARMMAEVIRIWHFQNLICRGKEIEASCSGDFNAHENYKKARDLEFRAFLREWSGSPDSHLRSLVEHPLAGYEMLHDEPTLPSDGSPVIHALFSAYKTLRFRHQANYADFKLQNHTDKLVNVLGWPSAVLQRRIQGFSTFCLLSSLICSLIIVGGHALHLEFSHHPILPFLVIVFLILTVAGRTLQDGLAAPEDFQRYNDYAGKTRYLLERFENSGNPSEKLDLMSEMERAALEELKGFLRAHSEARFVI